mmetsp:Transcript_14147/g.26550  ORF Transcript_14147/g.26550 Transcript_14147/m.26550 type:complete len:99 (-) Transcript_14147:4341-4637(-)
MRFRRWVGPTNNCTFSSKKGRASGLVDLAVYSPGRNRKKKARMIMSAVACWMGQSEAVAVADTLRKTAVGTGFTRCGGGSFLVKDESIRVIRKSCLPM